MTELPTTMTALRAHPPGGPDSLALDRVPVPRLQDGEVLVRVAAAAITRDELEWAEDRLPAIPSFELAGTVAAAPPGSAPAAGDEVFGMTAFDRDGAAAEYAVVAASGLAPRPAGLSWAEAAVVALPGLSALQGLVTHGHLTAGRRVLIHGAAGAVGGLAVQIARRLGAQVLATASGPRVEVARALGADVVIDVTAEDFTAIEPVDLVFDTVGGDRLERSPGVIVRGGRLVSISEEPPAGACAERGIDGVYFVVESDPEQLHELAALLGSGRVRGPEVTTFPLQQARAAFEQSLTGAGTGKAVLIP